MYPDHLELGFDPDSISALSDKRQAQWEKLQNADFLTRNERREAAGYGPVPGGDASDDDGDGEADVISNREAGHPAGFFNGKFNPYHDELGRFTFGPDDEDDSDDDNSDNTTAPSTSNPSAFGPGIFGLPANIDDPSLTPVSDNNTQNPYSTPNGITYGDKINGQMAIRGWTPDQIDNAVQKGDRIDAINNRTGGDATRYVDPDTGRSVVIDNNTNSVIQVGRDDFKYGVEGGDAPGAVMRPPPSSGGGGGGGFSPLNPKLPGEPDQEL